MKGGVRRLGVGFVVTTMLCYMLLPEPAFAAFFKSCASGTSTNYQLYQHRDPTGVRINGVIGEAWIKPLAPCTPDASNWSQSVVLPANMQYAYDNRVVQLGYGYCNPIPGATCAIGNAGPHFVWTPNDHNLLLASADGAGKYGGTPVLHHRYRFKIYPDGTQQKWWYCITPDPPKPAA